MLNLMRAYRTKKVRWQDLEKEKDIKHMNSVLTGIQPLNSAESDSDEEENAKKKKKEMEKEKNKKREKEMEKEEKSEKSVSGFLQKQRQEQQQFKLQMFLSKVQTEKSQNTKKLDSSEQS
eukprot:TRINITY_DN2150_c0_g1_i3.p1 TRINITY_DN2150_c0_g1~~TRINITY_DN2150_c0_g1_i3.p1  ORF type:complete len:120 (+),score=28.67 TRINITY_DN2150_c0_g1_i3:570-929(+)